MTLGTVLLGLVPDPGGAHRDLITVLEGLTADTYPVDLGPVGAAQVDHDMVAAAIVTRPDLGVAPTDIGIAQGDVAFRQPTD
jgi:hypothetical protein